MLLKRWTYAPDTPDERMLKSMRLWLRRAYLDQDERTAEIAVARLAFVVNYGQAPMLAPWRYASRASASKLR
jgi:hypothetical protein